MTKYLRAEDIANELDVSRTRAYEIMRECTRVVTGRSVRVTPQAFAAWKERHTLGPCESPSTSAETSGGAASGTPTAAVMRRFRRAAATRGRREPDGENLSDLPSCQPIRPRTRPRSDAP
jgi:hypothetical protein